MTGKAIEKTARASIKGEVSYSLAQKIVKSLREREIITSREGKIMLAALSDRAIDI